MEMIIMAILFFVIGLIASISNKIYTKIKKFESSTILESISDAAYMLSIGCWLIFLLIIIFVAFC